MTKMKVFGTITLLVILAAITAIFANAAALPVVIEEVKVDGTTVDSLSSNRLDVERGQDVPITVTVSSAVDLKDVRIEAFFGGHEYADETGDSDASHNFDMEANVTYVKKLNLIFPDTVEEDNYQLRVMVVDRNSMELIQRYALKIDVPRHELAIKEVTYPQYGTVAGRALLFTVRIKNNGEQDEESIRVKVTIPELGLATSPDYIDELLADDSTSSEELYVRVPACTEEGDYKAIAEVSYDEGYEKVTKEFIVKILGDETCQAPTEKPVDNGKPTSTEPVISVGADAQEVTAGVGGVVYPVTLTNPSASAKTFTINVEGADEWATVRVSPANTVIVGSGETKAVYVYVSAKETATPGQHMFVVNVKSGNDLVKQVPMTAVVASPEGKTNENNAGFDKVRNGLQIGLLVLVGLLVILGLIIGFNKLKGDDEDKEEVGSQTYY